MEIFEDFGPKMRYTVVLMRIRIFDSELLDADNVKISSKASWQVETKFYIGPQWMEETKICSNHPDKMPDMAVNF